MAGHIVGPRMGPRTRLAAAAALLLAAAALVAGDAHTPGAATLGGGLLGRYTQYAHAQLPARCALRLMRSAPPRAQERARRSRGARRACAPGAGRHSSHNGAQGGASGGCVQG